jgi:hypothetical protein
MEPIAVIARVQRLRQSGERWCSWSRKARTGDGGCNKALSLSIFMLTCWQKPESPKHRQRLALPPARQFTGRTMAKQFAGLLPVCPDL